MSYLEDFIEKLNTVPIDANRYLRHIRELDKKSEEMQTKLYQQQAAFLDKLKMYKQKKLDTKPLENQYNSIIKTQKFIYGMITQKVKVSEQLLELINQPAQKLELELSKIKVENKKNNINGVDDEFREQKDSAIKKKKFKAQFKIPVPRSEKKQQSKEWLYDKNQPKYCKCGNVSFGQMVECEYPYCQREWFHRQCILEKNLPEEWFCEDCRKLRQKMKNSNARFYL